MRVATTRVRHAPRDARRCRSAAAAPARACATRTRCCSPGCGPGEQLHRARPLAAARRAARGRRHAARARARRAPRRSRRSPARSSARSARSRRSVAPAYARRGLPAEREGRARRARAGLPAAARGHARAGTLLAGRRVLAHDRPGARAARPHDDRPDDRAGGDHRDGLRATPASPRWTRARARCSALAGIAFSDLQPPGSTMKIITATRRAPGRDRRRSAPCSRYADSGDDRRLHAPERERRGCGGTLLNAFAVSCNSVFAPLGATARRRAARRDGGAVRLQPADARSRARLPSEIPSASTIGDSLAVGSSAIGQGMVAVASRSR